ncbi:peptide deformylase, partial [Helicobacter pylori]
VLEASELLAVAIQHEIDHLNGVLFVDKLSILKRKKFEKELKELQKQQKRE